jgi:hypothetical protein
VQIVKIVTVVAVDRGPLVGKDIQYCHILMSCVSSRESVRQLQKHGNKVQTSHDCHLAILPSCHLATLSADLGNVAYLGEDIYDTEIDYEMKLRSRQELRCT